MKTMGIIATALSICVFQAACVATTWCIAPPPLGSDSNPGTHLEPFASIQKGIDTAAQGDTLIVAESTYVENIHFKGKNITLTSTDALDQDVVAKTIIDGSQSGSVVTFAGTENETCVLAGFTIRDGRAYYGGGISGGYGIPNHAVIQNNIVTGNSSTSSGGGITYCDGLIRNNLIYGNSADYGGGLSKCGGIIKNNVIAGNSAKFGGGLAYCHGIVHSNTITANSASGGGGGLYDCRGTIRNCIIWGNTGQAPLQLCDSATPTYSCILGWAGSLRGNIGYHPYFVDADNGDFHLGSWSPCTDAGDPGSPFSEEPEPNGGRINMGAYGNTPEAASKSPDIDADELPDDWELEVFGDLAQAGDDDPDGDLYPNLLEYLWGWDPTVGAGKLWHVDASVESSGDGTSWEKAFKTIQEGIDAASGGDIVTVARGTYVENIHFQGKNIIVPSTDPLDSEVVANTLIDGNQAGSVVTFSGTEDETSVLSGFTIRNGNAEYGGGICAGTEQLHTHATIRNNVITGNSADEDGGGLAYCDGTIQNNVITGNSAWSGGGLSDCDGLIQNNTISGNSAIGICESIVGAGYGGGLSKCDGTIQNNVISSNSTSYRGGGLMGSHGTIENNTIYGNSAYSGGGLDGCDGTIRNCIIWGNRAAQGPQLHESSEPTYSCIQNWTGGGQACIAFNPYFVDAENSDFHLRSWSPCIDAGDPSSDFSNEPEPNGARINMGTYGNTPDAASKFPDTDSDSLPDDWEVHWFGDLKEDADGDPDGDLIPNITEYLYARSPISAAEGRANNATKGAWYPTIQGALSESDDGDEIVVHPGVYEENIDFGGKNLVLRSTDPTDPEVVANTIIDGGRLGPVVTFAGTEDEACVLSGFTIRNGRGIMGNGTHATIRNNVIAGNSGSGWQAKGGGLCGCDGMIQNNVVTGNSAVYGGGLYDCNGTIQNNIITGNSASDGGGLYDCNGTIQNNMITGNSADAYWFGGGGLTDCDGTIQNNVITGNSAWRGGGLYACGGTIQNNTISGNSATGWQANGGGLSACNGTIQNNTISGNCATGWQAKGGGLYDCHGTIQNCVIWANRAREGAQLWECVEPTYSCIQDWIGGGEGNIPLDPRFVDPENGDFHLTPWSPCIDAGNPSSPFSKEPGPNGGRVNIGAYGNTAEATPRSRFEDTDSDGLPDDWEVHYFGDLDEGGAGDRDEDHILNITEYRYAWDPTTAADTLVENLAKALGYETIQAALSESDNADEI